MKIKVCGMKGPENMAAVAALKPDYMGFINYSKSPRFINGLPPDALTALPESVIKTGVFVNETMEVIDSLIGKYGFDAIQLHGSETPELCHYFKGKVQVIKAFGMDDGFNFEQLTAYSDCVDYFLFDSKTDIHGGSGKTFNWNILDRYQMDVPFFLSGGISMDKLADIKQIKHPAFYGVDLNSRFELQPGLKDVQKLIEAFNILR